MASITSASDIEQQDSSHELTSDFDSEEITFDAIHASLIVRRVLSSQMEKEEQGQRHNLFQSKFVIKEHSCKVIIDD